MKIGINGQNLLKSQRAGPENYLLNLVNNLSQIDSKNKYVVYVDVNPKNLTINQEDQLKFLNSNNFEIKYIKKIVSWTQVSLAMELITNPVNVFFSSQHTVPIIRNPKTKYVAMIHGLEYMYGPKNLKPLKILFKGSHEWFLSFYCNKVIVPSLATKEDLLKKYSFINKDKVKVVYEGVSDEFKIFSREETQPLLKKYGLEHKNYLIFISTIQPRKNLDNLIKGFGLLIKQDPAFKDLKLAVVGKKGWNYRNTLHLPKKLGISKNVAFLGRIPQKELPKVLSSAKIFVSSSFKEGFGLPLIEAMQSGVPCVVSNIPAYQESAQNIALFFDPKNPEDIKNKITELLEKSEIEIKQLIEKGINKTKEYNWQDTAKQTLKILENL